MVRTSISCQATQFLFRHLSAGTIEEASLQLVRIHFNTDTYDEIERDVKVTVTAQVGLIGGTMGLLTGFSILSGVEILYYLGRFILMTFWITKENEGKDKT